MHRAIADKLHADPALLAVAHDNLDRWSKTNRYSKPYFDSWRELLGCRSTNWRRSWSKTASE